MSLPAWFGFEGIGFNATYCSSLYGLHFLDSDASVEAFQTLENEI
jgi:hypothetical protein